MIFSEYQCYKGFRLVNVPSGLGGSLPAALLEEIDAKVKVLCLHSEFYPGWTLKFDASHVKPLSYRLTAEMRDVIDNYIASN